MGEIMARADYHRQQARILASLAISTSDPERTEYFKLAAMEHLARAQEREQLPQDRNSELSWTIGGTD
jgi:hypothetical protein